MAWPCEFVFNKDHFRSGFFCCFCFCFSMLCGFKKNIHAWSFKESSSVVRLIVKKVSPPSALCTPPIVHFSENPFRLSYLNLLVTIAIYLNFTLLFLHSSVLGVISWLNGYRQLHILLIPLLLQVSFLPVPLFLDKSYIVGWSVFRACFIAVM